MKNIKLIIAYDGTNYRGWQKNRTAPTIEGALETTLEQICQHPIQLQAASRTDAGVHARGQVVNFIAKKSWDFSRLKSSLNQLLPSDIAVLNVSEANLKFHPTLNNIGKEYRYYICNSNVQLPEHRLYSWHIRDALDTSAVQKAIPHLLGKHDFSSFCNHRPDHQYTSYVRQLNCIHFQFLEDNRYCFIIQGNDFLYRMVRNIVGTLVDIGRGKLKEIDLPSIITTCDRASAGLTAPGHGLFLEAVYY